MIIGYLSLLESCCRSPLASTACSKLIFAFSEKKIDIYAPGYLKIVVIIITLILLKQQSESVSGAL